MTLLELFKKTVFLLGAGASRDAGCLMSSNMLNDLGYKINGIAADFKPFCDYKEGFQELYKIIMSSLSYQAKYKGISTNNENFYSPNIEDFILILRKILNKHYIIPVPLVGSWSEELLLLELKYAPIGNIFQKFLDFIYYCVDEWLTPISYDPANHMLSPIKKFLEETNSEDYCINIFTLNYDLVFEKVFNTDSEQPLNNGFSKKYIEENSEFFYWDTNSFDITNNKINYYKIHGSLDWFKKKDETLAMPCYKTAFNPNNPEELKPHLILGYENKLFSVDPFFTLFQEFIRKITDAHLVVVIGYSFFDSYINNILIKYLNKGANNKLLIVDPCFSTKDDPHSKFIDYIKVIQSDSSTLNIENNISMPSSKIEFFTTSNGETPGASQFYLEYFSGQCKRLLEIASALEKIDTPF